MTWKEFYDIAAPEEIRFRESQKNFFVRLSRWFSTRQAYFLHHMGVTGNMVSLFRIVLSAVALYLFYCLTEGRWGSAFLGILLMAWQLNLDGTDGSLARVQKATGPLGAVLDNIGCNYSYYGFWVVVALMTDRVALVLLSLVTGYILVNIRHGGGETLPAEVDSRFRWALYTPLLLVVIPTMMILLSLLFSPHVVAWVVSVGYLMIAVVWLGLYIRHYSVVRST